MKYHNIHDKNEIKKTSVLTVFHLSSATNIAESHSQCRLKIIYTLAHRCCWAETFAVVGGLFEILCVFTYFRHCIWSRTEKKTMKKIHPNDIFKSAHTFTYKQKETIFSEIKRQNAYNTFDSKHIIAEAYKLRRRGSHSNTNLEHQTTLDSVKNRRNTPTHQFENVFNCLLVQHSNGLICMSCEQ